MQGCKLCSPLPMHSSVCCVCGVCGVWLCMGNRCLVVLTRIGFFLNPYLTHLVCVVDSLHNLVCIYYT
eukprot:NODE_5008_length_433_cov_108.041667_g4344_i0.p2 GENE.NODE_5008_length_433_cov_108.041667_g4344_i0~~NODE_5008_length_433_cov_108.041667_g4344_i0.p2  ORF type:complete len:68 (-),score=19.15 NODE_5008_length_433_cov_108.041667_g4344_i0:2-205(-)